jgi:hypothetical protein
MSDPYQEIVVSTAQQAQTRTVTQKNLDGGFHRLALQQENMSCGPAGIRYVYQLINNRELGEDFFRGLVERAEAGAAGAAYQGSLGQEGPVTPSGQHFWVGSGTSFDALKKAFEAVRPKITCMNGGRNLLLSTTRIKPAIATVQWLRGGDMHYIVVAGPLQRRNPALAGRTPPVQPPHYYLVLDPYYGVQFLEKDRQGGLSGYQPLDPNTGRVLGTGGIKDAVLKIM